MFRLLTKDLQTIIYFLQTKRDFSQKSPHRAKLKDGWWLCNFYLQPRHTYIQLNLTPCSVKYTLVRVSTTKGDTHTHTDRETHTHRHTHQRNTYTVHHTQITVQWYIYYNKHSYILHTLIVRSTANTTSFCLLSTHFYTRFFLRNTHKHNPSFLLRNTAWF